MTYVERCLYEYRENLALIDTLKSEIEDLLSVRAQNYESNIGGGQSNPVEAVTMKKLYLERRLNRVERTTRTIKRLDEDLCGSDVRVQQMSRILKLKYFRGESIDYVLRSMAISPSTYWRRNGELLRKARKYLGEE